MELTVRGKNLEITEALRTYVEKHTGKIQRYFDKPIKINVLLRISNMTKTCEVTAFVDGVILRGVEKSTTEHRFTWQPHGSQFTIIEEIPEDSLLIKIKEPEMLNKEDVLKALGFDKSWISITKRS